MKLLVTGGCGFIGSNFVNYYFKENSEVTIVNLDAMYYCASENNVNEAKNINGKMIEIKMCEIHLGII